MDKDLLLFVYTHNENKTDCIHNNVIIVLVLIVSIFVSKWKKL